MSSLYPDLSQRILEMSEGDEEFKVELTSAIYNGLVELETKYSEGLQNKDELKIQQIRHKLKPTLSMFEFNELTDSLQEGKTILETEGFGAAFELHFHDFLQKLKIAISEVENLNN
mgnify:CR=1 FL=1